MVVGLFYFMYIFPVVSLSRCYVCRAVPLTQMWLTYSPIPNLAADFYHVSVEQVDWFSTSYFLTSLFVGFISIGVLDVFGLKLAVGFL